MLKKIKIKRKRSKRATLKIILYIFFTSSLILSVLNFAFPKFSWFTKKAPINPVAERDNQDKASISQLMKDANIKFLSVNPSSNYFEVKLKDGGNVYISSKKDVRAQISSLQAILKQLTIKGERFNSIDFRFEKPVVKYTKSHE